jgi:hypothetical protein
MKDKISPKYYQTKIQPIDFIQANNLNFCQGNVIKYTVRYQAKNGKEDLLKARQYLDFLIKDYEDIEKTNMSKEKNLSYIQLPLKQAPFLYSTAICFFDKKKKYGNKIPCNLLKPAIEIPCNNEIPARWYIKKTNINKEIKRKKFWIDLPSTGI